MKKIVVSSALKVVLLIVAMFCVRAVGMDMNDFPLRFFDEIVFSSKLVLLLIPVSVVSFISASIVCMFLVKMFPRIFGEGK